MSWGVGVASVHAARQSRHQVVSGWRQKDAAIYVVSTLNLVRTRDGQALPGVLTEHLGVERFDVYVDGQTRGLYFIELQRADGSRVGTLAYHMGWLKPQAVSALSSQLGLARATGQVSRDYKTDFKQLIGSFTSTMPS